MHRTTSRFWRCFERLPESVLWRCFERLPESVQRIARQNFEILKANPRHPSLHFKKVGNFWSARVSINHRTLALEDGEDFTWVWIGTHEEYERLIRRMG